MPSTQANRRAFLAEGSLQPVKGLAPARPEGVHEGLALLQRARDDLRYGSHPRPPGAELFECYCVNVLPRGKAAILGGRARRRSPVD